MCQYYFQSKSGSSVFAACELINIPGPLPDLVKTSANVPACIWHEVVKAARSQTFFINMRWHLTLAFQLVHALSLEEGSSSLLFLGARFMPGDGSQRCQQRVKPLQAGLRSRQY